MDTTIDDMLIRAMKKRVEMGKAMDQRIAQLTGNEADNYEYSLGVEVLSLCDAALVQKATRATQLERDMKAEPSMCRRCGRLLNVPVQNGNEPDLPQPCRCEGGG